MNCKDGYFTILIGNEKICKDRQKLLNKLTQINMFPAERVYYQDNMSENQRIFIIRFYKNRQHYLIFIDEQGYTNIARGWKVLKAVEVGKTGKAKLYTLEPVTEYGIDDWSVASYKKSPSKSPNKSKKSPKKSPRKSPAKGSYTKRSSPTKTPSQKGTYSRSRSPNASPRKGSYSVRSSNK